MDEHLRPIYRIILENVEKYPAYVKAGFPVRHVFQKERRIPLRLSPPSRHRRFPRVIGGHRANVVSPVIPHQVGQISSPQSHVQLRIEKVLATGFLHLLLAGDRGGRARHELHKADGPGRRQGVDLEKGLLADDGM